MKGKILEEAKRVFKPEFLNRLDDQIVFHTLTKTDLMRIVDLEVSKVTKRVRQKAIDVVLDASAHEFLIEKGYDPTYGARPMRRAVEKFLEDPLAEELLRGNIKALAITPLRTPFAISRPIKSAISRAVSASRCRFSIT